MHPLNSINDSILRPYILDDTIDCTEHLFANQIAGHDQLLHVFSPSDHQPLKNSKGDQLSEMILKPATWTEIQFYFNAINDTAVVRWIPPFCGLLSICPTTPLHRIMSRKLDFSGYHICMGNLVGRLHSPFIMDLKIGNILYDAQATAAKKQRMISMAQSTTSGTHGVRIAGMQLHHADSPGNIRYMKEYGKSLKTTSDLLIAFKLFFQLTSPHQRDLFLRSLRDLKEVISVSRHLRLISTSLLLVYDSDDWNHVGVTIIDFAHSTVDVALDSCDEGFLFGVETAIDLVSKVSLSLDEEQLMKLDQEQNGAQYEEQKQKS